MNMRGFVIEVAPLSGPLVTGDALTFQDFFEAQFLRLTRLATAMTGGSIASEDLAQDVLIRLYRDWPRVARMDRPDLYARRALVNAVVSQARRTSRLRRHLAQRDATDDHPDRLAE